MFQIRKEIATTEIRKKEIQLIQEDTIQTNKIIIDPEIDTTRYDSSKNYYHTHYPPHQRQYPRF